MDIIKYKLFCYLLPAGFGLLQDTDKGIWSYISIVNPRIMNSLILNNM